MEIMPIRLTFLHHKEHGAVCHAVPAAE
jgi:hypothetical protein